MTSSELNKKFGGYFQIDVPLQQKKRRVKAAIEREKSEACFNYPEREQARPQVKSERVKSEELTLSNLALRREWGFALLCGAESTFSTFSKDPSRPEGEGKFIG